MFAERDQGSGFILMLLIGEGVSRERLDELRLVDPEQVRLGELDQDARDTGVGWSAIACSNSPSSIGPASPAGSGMKAVGDLAHLLTGEVVRLEVLVPEHELGGFSGRGLRSFGLFASVFERLYAGARILDLLGGVRELLIKRSESLFTDPFDLLAALKRLDHPLGASFVSKTSRKKLKLT